MKSDIESRADIERLLDEFYKVAIHDPKIGNHFDELDLEQTFRSSPISGKRSFSATPSTSTIR